LSETNTIGYIAQDTQMRAIEAEQLAHEEFPDIENLRTRNQELLQVLQAKEARREALSQILLRRS